MIYASEADILNKALFGITAKEWSENNHDKKGNMRDCADVLQLVVLANLESLNSEYIKENIPADKRLIKLNAVAISQMKSLLKNENIKNLKGSIKNINEFDRKKAARELIKKERKGKNLFEKEGI